MSMTDYKKDAIKALAADIVKSGFRAFIAERGTYGFFTDADGTRTIGFQYDLGGIEFTYNYKSDQPRQTGTGCRIEAGDYGHMLNQGPPGWATRGANARPVTLAQHLATYQQSSKYTEFTGEVFTAKKRNEILVQVRDFARAPYAFPGGYPKMLIMRDGEVLCAGCAKSEYKLISAATRNDLRDSWAAAGVELHMEGSPYQCAHCNTDIDSAYGEPDSDGE